jgi:hypothetical protein
MSTAIYGNHAELKDLINKSINAQDASLDILLDAASRAIDGRCNHPDGFLSITTATARFYPGSGKPYQRIDECTAITAVAVKDSSTDDENAYTAWTVGVVGTTIGADVFPCSGDPKYPDYTSLPYTLLVIGTNGDFDHFPTGKFTTRGGFRPSSGIARSIPTVKITANWGYSITVPSQVKTATIAQASRWFKRFESAFADTVASAELGQLLYKQSLDPDIEAMLVAARLVRPAVGRR